MEKKMSITKAIQAGRNNVSDHGGNQYSTFDDKMKAWSIGTIPSREQKVYFLRNLKVFYAIVAMYGYEVADQHRYSEEGGTYAQPGSLEEIVKMAVADIERTYK